MTRDLAILTIGIVLGALWIYIAVAILLGLTVLIGLVTTCMRAIRRAAGRDDQLADTSRNTLRLAAREQQALFRVRARPISGAHREQFVGRLIVQQMAR